MAVSPERVVCSWSYIGDCRQSDSPAVHGCAVGRTVSKSVGDRDWIRKRQETNTDARNTGQPAGFQSVKKKCYYDERRKPKRDSWTRVGRGNGAREDDGTARVVMGGNLIVGACLSRLSLLSLSLSLFLSLVAVCLFFHNNRRSGSVVGRGGKEGMGKRLGAVSDFVTAAFRDP